MNPRDRIHERTDLLSDRHRIWGFGCPATDLDLVMIEYDQGIAFAVIEYKAGLERKLTEGERWSLRAIKDLADRADLPAYVVKFEDDPWRFHVQPLGARGAGQLPMGDHDRVLTEQEYVDFLYQLRGRRAAPPEVRGALHDRMAAA